MVVQFKTDVANTGAATLNVNALGAQAILKMRDQALVTGDIEAAQVVTVVWDGTNWQMQSQLAAVRLSDDLTPALGGDLNVAGRLLKDANGNELLDFGAVAAAINYLKLFNSIAGVSVELRALGDDTDIGIYLEPKGAGRIGLGGDLNMDNRKIVDTYFKTLLDFSATINAVNYLKVINSITGVAAELQALGSDTNIDLQLTPKGSGKLQIPAAVVNLPSGGNITVNAANPKQTIVLGAGGWPSTTAGCAALAKSELATNKQNLQTFDFDKDTVEYLEFTGVLPDNYDGGTLTARFYWLHPATTVNFKVAWAIQGRAYADDDALDQAWGSAVQVNDIGGTTSDLYVTAESAAITLAGTPAGGQLVQFRLQRVATDATNDTLAVDAKLLCTKIEYGVSAFSA